MVTTWIILVAISIVLWAICFFMPRINGILGGLSIGVIIGLILAIFFAVKGYGFDWLVIGKIAIIGTLIGLVADLLGILKDYIKRKCNE